MTLNARYNNYPTTIILSKTVTNIIFEPFGEIIALSQPFYAIWAIMRLNKISILDPFCSDRIIKKISSIAFF